MMVLMLFWSGPSKGLLKGIWLQIELGLCEGSGRGRSRRRRVGGRGR